jgi:hypothetical protein
LNEVAVCCVKFSGRAKTKWAQQKCIVSESTVNLLKIQDKEGIDAKT